MDEESTPQPTTTPALPRLPYASKRGGHLWQQCQPLLDWLIKHGDADLQAQALRARAYWEQECGYFIDWGNKNHYFEFCEIAMRDLKGFKETIKLLPAETPIQVEYWPDGAEEPKQVDLVIWLALQVGERHARKNAFRQRKWGK